MGRGGGGASASVGRVALDAVRLTARAQRLRRHRRARHTAGELQDLKNELNGDTKEKRKNAIKKTIASMTVGKDVGSLFPDVLKNMQAEDLETKKLVYLYLMNYAKSNPEIAILAVNTFVKVRARARRDMPGSRRTPWC